MHLSVTWSIGKIITEGTKCGFWYSCFRGNNVLRREDREELCGVNVKHNQETKTDAV